MNSEQETIFDDLISQVYADRASTQPSFTDYSNHDGQSWDDEVNDRIQVRPFNNIYSIDRDGMAVYNNITGEVHYPANCDNEYYFVLMSKRGKFIKSAAVAVFEAFTDPRYVEDAKKVGYTLIYKDGDKSNPNYDNIHIKFNQD